MSFELFREDGAVSIGMPRQHRYQLSPCLSNEERHGLLNRLSAEVGL